MLTSQTATLLEKVKETDDAYRLAMIREETKKMFTFNPLHKSRIRRTISVSSSIGEDETIPPTTTRFSLTPTEKRTSPWKSQSGSTTPIAESKLGEGTLTPTSQDSKIPFYGGKPQL